MAAVFDTLKLAMKLEKSGFTPKQSQETAVALAESFSEWQTTINLATKDDLREVKDNVQAVRRDVEAVRVDLRALELKLEAKITTTVAECKTEIIKWMFGIIGVQTLAIIGAVLGILRFSGH